MGKTTIEWCSHTWNPLRGCVKITPGCRSCYASAFAERWRGVAGHAYEQGFDLRLVPHKLAEPLTWTDPSVVFVNSMSDLFQDGVPERYIETVWDVMAAADWHVHQVLTKRSEQMRRLVDGLQRRQPRHAALTWDSDRTVLEHIWLGVSVENRKHGLPRIDHLRQTPAAIRFLSVEPLIEDLGEIDLEGIDLVIVGGESGPKARPMDTAWVHSIHTQCVDQGVRFFFKQWGGVNKKAAGRLLHGRTWDDMPPLTRAPYPGRAVVKARRVALRLDRDELVSLGARS